MPETEVLFAFLAAAAVFAYMPGPSMLYTAAQTIARGQRAGWGAVLGIHIGGYAHVIVASFGMAALFQTVPVAYTVLKLAGAAYLIWIALQFFREAPPTDLPVAQTREKTARRALWQSISVEVLNPKTALFYLAFLPQFTDPSASFPIWMQLCILGTFVNVMFTSADIACVILADRVAQAFGASQRAGRYVRRIGGSILIGLGLNLLFSRSAP